MPGPTHNLTILIEIDAGTSLNEAAKQMVVLSRRLDTWVQAQFNDSTLLASPDDMPGNVLDRYYRWDKQKEGK